MAKDVGQASDECRSPRPSRASDGCRLRGRLAQDLEQWSIALVYEGWLHPVSHRVRTRDVCRRAKHVASATQEQGELGAVVGSLDTAAGRSD
jgi:hypothetical protein